MLKDIMAFGLSDYEIEQLKVKVHTAAREGMAISIFALLLNMDKDVINNILNHVTEHDGQKTTPLIIASMLGEIKVIKVLLQNFDVKLEQKSVVRFDGYVIQEATALWCASGAGHLDIVKILIKSGADINNSTATNSTPLRAACFDGRLDIVKYLLEHGADMNIPNKYNNTCLMISCYKGHTDVVRHLLQKGANPDLKAHCGATSLHFAAECGHLEVVKELLHFGAGMVANDLKMTPLMVAAECGKENIVDYFLKQPMSCREQNIEALELLGASFANDKENYSLQKTFQYLKEAMILRHLDERTPMFSQSQNTREDVIPKPAYPAVFAYGNRTESQNLHELIAISNNRDALHMEALTIRERILGPDNPEIPHPVIFRGAVFADSGRFDRCIALWMHAMVLRQKNRRSICKDLLRFSQVFAQMVNVMANLKYSDIEEVLVYGLRELKLFLSDSTKSDSDSAAMEMYQSNIMSVIYLITTGLHIITSEEESISLHKFVYCFLNIKPCLKNGYSPLHIVLDPGICVDDFHVDSIVIFPDIKLAEMFIECGADVNALDYKRNSPLHVIATADIDTEKEIIRQRIVKILLNSGAHADIANCYRQTPLILANNRQELVSILTLQSNFSLKCLASRCIREHNLEYEEDIPKFLSDFVQLH